jgi:hypothetical protein
MDLSTSFSEINWLSVIVATLAAFAIGGLWYSPVLFSKTWQKEVKLSDQDIKDVNMGLIFGSSFVLNFISAVVLELFIGKQAGVSTGLMAGLFVGVGWVATSLGTNYLFARKSLKLFFIDACYFIVYFAVMGIILGAW